MAKFRFGTKEEIVCIADVAVQKKDLGEACIAYKTSTHYFGAGMYVKDDGYVLGSRAGGSTYYPLDQKTIQAHQAAHELPSPLPAYSLSFGTYAEGYSVWIILVIALLIGIGKKLLADRRKTHLDALRSTQPVHLGPPDLRTKADHFIYAQVAPHLLPGEQIQHQAYGIDRDTSEGGLHSMSAMGVFGILTTRRLVLIKTRLGAFGVLLENKGMEGVDRDAVLDVHEQGELLTFSLADGSRRQIHVKLGARGLTNQLVFLRDVPRLLGPHRSMTPYSIIPAMHSAR